jgi:hypothetical protein
VSRHLCTRCGAVAEAPDPAAGEAVHGACPECGLGFTSWGMTAALREGPEAPEDRTRREEAERRHRADALRAVAERTFPLHGLDAAWTGRRWLGGWGAHDGRVDRVTLGHGDAWDATAPLVRVETHRDDDPWTWRDTAQGLAFGLFHDTGEHTERHRDPYGPGEPPSWWDPVGLVVDGVPTPLRLLRSGAQWIAVGATGGHVLAVTARHVEPAAVRLVQVTDVEPYLADDGGPR